VSLTPIYDQLRGERINADVPATDVGTSDAAESEPMPSPRRRMTGEAARITPLFSRPPDPVDEPSGTTVTSVRPTRPRSR
jgi:hypothetical protein